MQHTVDSTQHTRKHHPKATQNSSSEFPLICHQLNNTFVKKWQGKGVWAGVVSCGEVTRKIKVYLTRFIFIDFSAPMSYL